VSLLYKWHTARQLIVEKKTLNLRVRAVCV
jgi:hypothetical protein